MIGFSNFAVMVPFLPDCSRSRVLRCSRRSSSLRSSRPDLPASRSARMT
jgi:hypothetical protein